MALGCKERRCPWKGVGLVLAAVATCVTLSCQAGTPSGDPPGWDPMCAHNLRALYGELFGVLYEQDRRVALFKAVSSGEDPLIWMAKERPSLAEHLLCPADPKRLEKPPRLDESSYETWPWNEEIWPVLENLQGTIPEIWEKRPLHSGKRMVARAGGIDLMEEDEFRRRMDAVRQELERVVKEDAE